MENCKQDILITVHVPCDSLEPYFLVMSHFRLPTSSLGRVSWGLRGEIYEMMSLTIRKVITIISVGGYGFTVYRFVSACT